MSHPLIFVVGPTASGKSALALELAQEFQGAILNCDSLQVYRRMDIGTAKPSLEERSRVPHLMFDVCNPGEVLTAGDFRRLALESLKIWIQRGPVFAVGGSGFYIQALEKGMFEVPKADPAIDRAVRAELTAHGLASLYQQLQQLDPECAQDLNPKDSYRIVRALVIIRQTGRRVSDLRRSFRPDALPYRYVKLGLRPSREDLLPVVESRARTMLETGLVEEVSSLLSDGFGAWPPLQSVGYKQCLEFLNGQITREQLPVLIVEKTIQLAKKQRTWFQRDSQIQWLDFKNPLPQAREIVIKTVSAGDGR